MSCKAVWIGYYTTLASSNESFIYLSLIVPHQNHKRKLETNKTSAETGKMNKTEQDKTDRTINTSYILSGQAFT